MKTSKATVEYNGSAKKHCFTDMAVGTFFMDSDGKLRQKLSAETFYSYSRAVVFDSLLNIRTGELFLVVDVTISVTLNP